MKRNTINWMTILMVVGFMTMMASVLSIMSSCTNSNEDDFNASLENVGKGKYFDQLVGTTWVYHSSRNYDKNGNITNEWDFSKNSTYMTTYDVYYMFRSDLVYDMSSYGYGEYEMYVDQPNKQKTSVSMWEYHTKNDSIRFQSYSGKIVKLTSNELVIRGNFSDTSGYFEKKFEKAGERIHYLDDNSGNGNNGGGNGSSTDPPYVTDFTFTATKTSITVKFMCSERPNSATISYGESSANKTLSTSIAGKQVSATATGLKSGTKYYFKCKVSNQNGSSTSDGWSAITNF